MTTNNAAWLTSAKAKPLTVKEAPFPTPGESQVVIKNAAVALNPIDWYIQDMGIFDFIKYPFILGSDVAGTVVSVGSSVTKLRVGDRVLGQAVGLVTSDSSQRAFQQYVVLREALSAPLPDQISFERAAVLPLGVSTAACCLYQEISLNLPLPSTATARGSTGKALLVWGAASSVGANAVQLAVASGYEVFATASPKNFAMVEALGASRTFDYRSASVVDDIVEACRGKTLAGAVDCVTGDIEGVAAVLRRSEGANKFVAMAARPAEKLPEDMQTKWVFASSIADSEMGAKVYEFVGQGLAQGKYSPAPEPLVVGHGLESFQEALDTIKKGVSAKKIVVTL